MEVPEVDIDTGPPWSGGVGLDEGADAERGHELHTTAATQVQLGLQSQVDAVSGGEITEGDRTNVVERDEPRSDSECARVVVRYSHHITASARLRGLAPATRLRGSSFTACLRGSPVAVTAANIEPADLAGSGDLTVTNISGDTTFGPATSNATTGPVDVVASGSGIDQAFDESVPMATHDNVSGLRASSSSESIIPPSSPAPSYRTTLDSSETQHERNEPAMGRGDDEEVVRQGRHAGHGLDEAAECLPVYHRNACDDPRHVPLATPPQYTLNSTNTTSCAPITAHSTSTPTAGTRTPINPPSPRKGATKMAPNWTIPSTDEVRVALEGSRTPSGSSKTSFLPKHNPLFGFVRLGRSREREDLALPPMGF